MDKIKTVAKAIVAAITPLVLELLNQIGDLVNAQASVIISAAVTAAVVYLVPNKPT